MLVWKVADLGLTYRGWVPPLVFAFTGFLLVMLGLAAAPAICRVAASTLTSWKGREDRAFLRCRARFASTRACCAALGADVVEVRLPEQLDGLDGLVIPGGESTTMMRLARALRPRRGDPAVRGADLRDLRGDDPARPRAARSDRPRRSAQRVRAPGGELRGRSRDRGRGRAVSGRIHPGAVDRRGRPGRRDPRRGRRSSGARARRAGARRVVPPGADATTRGFTSGFWRW